MKKSRVVPVLASLLDDCLRRSAAKEENGIDFLDTVSDCSETIFGVNLLDTANIAVILAIVNKN